MRIVCIGGGPAGLFLSILLKKARPDTQVTLLERNPPDGLAFLGDARETLRGKMCDNNTLAENENVVGREVYEFHVLISDDSTRAPCITSNSLWAAVTLFPRISSTSASLTLIAVSARLFRLASTIFPTRRICETPLPFTEGSSLSPAR